MDASTIRQVLANAQNPDPNTRNQAEEQLKQSFATDPAKHLFLLSQELADEAAPAVQTRMLAGLSLKNFMTSKDHAQAVKLANDWMALNPEVRTNVKNNSTVALSSGQREVRMAAAQVISKVATIELPKLDGAGKSQWEELMPMLLNAVVEPEASPAGMARKEAALHTIGYICEEIAQLETTCLDNKSNDILTAVVAGMRTEEQDLSVKLAATRALSNALEFAHRNFEVEAERNYIMTVICEACTTAASDEVKEIAFQCLCRIAELYYDKLPSYIQTLLEMSLSAIQSQADAVARQAIAFWSTVCDMEYEILNEDDRPCHKFIMGATSFLVPVLLRTMTQQEDGQDEDSYNKSTEAAACVSAVASVVCDTILEHVVPWVRENIQSPDWRLREAAVMAFGCIMDGPSDEVLGQYVGPVMDMLIGYLNDSEDLVKNSSAWTITRICEMAPAAIAQHHIAPLCEKIMEAIPKNEPATANHLCWALHHIANNVKNMFDDVEIPANPLSPVFTRVVKCLMDTGDRNDATEANLRANAYEALNVVVSTADPECKKNFIIPTLLPELGERLNKTFTMNCLNADDLNQRNEWQSYLCGALQTCISATDEKTLTAVDASGMTTADKFMHLFLQVFSSQNTTAAQEALLAVESVVNALPNGGFDRYMASFGPMLVVCLQSSQEPALCLLAVTTTSDIAHQLKDKVLQYSDPIVETLLTVVSRPEVDAQIREVHDYIKPAIYSCLGDVAMAIGAGMDKYLQYWFTALQQGCQLAVQMKEELGKEGYDEDKRMYLNSLMEGILDGYTGIVHGLKTASKSVPGAIDAFLNPVALQQGCLVLIQAIASDEEKSEDVLRTTVGLVGDLADAFGVKVKPMLQIPEIIDKQQGLLQQASESSDPETERTGKWAAGLVA